MTNIEYLLQTVCYSGFTFVGFAYSSYGQEKRTRGKAVKAMLHSPASPEHFTTFLYTAAPKT
jgi:hypothetical protein